MKRQWFSLNVLLIAIVFVGCQTSRDATDNGNSDTSEIAPASDTLIVNEAPGRTTVKIALLDYDGVGGAYERESNGERMGCDRVVFVEREVEPTTAPLTAAMNLLFSFNETEVAGWQHFIAQTNETLSFERARVPSATGTASIYLSGRLSGLAGVCDNPRARIQITQTALQYPNVRNVQIYLNGEPTDLQPSGNGG